MTFGKQGLHADWGPSGILPSSRWNDKGGLHLCRCADWAVHVTGAFFGVFVLCQQKFTFKKEEVTFGVSEKVKVLATQSCLTLCHPIDYSLPGSSVHGILQAGMLDHFLLQGMFSTQGSNPGLIHCRQLPSESPGKPLGVSISPK